MQYRQLGQTGLNVSVIGFGGIPIQRLTDEEADRVIRKALEAGINFFDTARAYTDSEAKLGRILAGCVDQVIIATKSLARTAVAMREDVDKSLSALNVQRIDLYQLHNVKDEAALKQVLGPDGALAALREAREQGKIKHIGITGHIKPILIEAIKTGAFETVQFPFNPVETAGAEEIFTLADQMAMGTIIMKPLAGGAFRDASLPLRFILEHPICTVIPGMDSVEQINQNVGLVSERAHLTASERETLNREAALLGSEFCRRCEYCAPCDMEIDIPTVFLLDGYYTRYDLVDWAQTRYKGMTVQADACTECGVCEERCPYDLPIRRKLTEAHQRLRREQ